MRYLYIVVVAVVFMFCAASVLSGSVLADCGMCGSENNSQADKVEKKAPLADDAEFGEDNRREMPQDQNYDENTGMPNVVGSDTAGELQ